jgi:hypothetical protein
MDHAMQLESTHSGGLMWRKEVDIAAILERFDALESVQSIAMSLGVSRSVVLHRLRLAGREPRGRREARLAMHGRSDPSERRARIEVARRSRRVERG